MDYRSISEQAQHYVRSFFDSHLNDKLSYHNWLHTKDVTSAARQIADHYTLNDADLFIVTTAACFHDIGYLTGATAGHEERGAAMAASFLGGTGVEKTVIDAIRGCILATQLPQRAEGLLQQIVCDADLFHLGTDEFGERNKLMRKETEAIRNTKISKDQWRRETIRFVGGHQYYTDYCRALLNEKQGENLGRLKQKDEEEHRDIARQASGTGTPGGAGLPGAIVSQAGLNLPATSNPIDDLLRRHEAAEGEELENQPVIVKEKKKKKKDPGRGIDTVFRITSNNNQRLSSQADSKAHILIQVNSIIISVLLSLLLRKIEDHTNLEIPAIILLTVNLVTIIFSILATRPQIPTGTFSKADLEQKKVNLLFFGNFYRMTIEEYASGMLLMMDDKDFLYGSLIRDVYNQGIVLGRKYHWLRLSYNVFMYGLIASVFSFMIAALLYPAK